MSADTDSLGFRRFMNKLHPIILFYIFWQADDENYASFIIGLEAQKEIDIFYFPIVYKMAMPKMF